MSMDRDLIALVNKLQSVKSSSPCHLGDFIDDIQNQSSDYRDTFNAIGGDAVDL
jgi:hypothetical protein